MCVTNPGGGSGIGLECARRFVREGARVVLGDRNVEPLAAATAELGAAAAARTPAVATLAAAMVIPMRTQRLGTE